MILDPLRMGLVVGMRDQTIGQAVRFQQAWKQIWLRRFQVELPGLFWDVFRIAMRSGTNAHSTNSLPFLIVGNRCSFIEESGSAGLQLRAGNRGE